MTRGDEIMKVPRRRVRSALLVSAFVLAGCGPTPAATPVLQLQGVGWRAIEVDGQPTIPGSQPTITFNDGHISGSGGCNTFSGDVAISDGTVDVGELRATLLTCDGPAGDAEVVFMRALVSASTVSPGEGGQLLLDGSGGLIRLEPKGDG
jgi:heat shock protein HslJ